MRVTGIIKCPRKNIKKVPKNSANIKFAKNLKSPFYMGREIIITILLLWFKWLFKDKESSILLAQILSKSKRTISREIKRGIVEQLKTDLTKEKEYNADYALKGCRF